MLKAIIFASVLVSPTFAMDKVIYGGEDNRKDFYDVSEAMQKLAASTVALVEQNQIYFDNQSLAHIGQRTLEDENQMCSDEPFIHQPAAASCSGFLVAPNIVVTAGHCVEDEYSCRSFNYVFDYKADTAEQDKFRVNRSKVYRCKRVIKSVLDDQYMPQDTGLEMDYAIIELDRDVTDREPLKMRTEGKLEDNAELVVIGHPSGLPVKITDGATVMNNQYDAWFSANLDTFGGNSGSAVFNRKTGLVEGILVRGESDYDFDYEKLCTFSNHCDESCEGEDVTRIAPVVEALGL